MSYWQSGAGAAGTEVHDHSDESNGGNIPQESVTGLEAALAEAGPRPGDGLAFELPIATHDGSRNWVQQAGSWSVSSADPGHLNGGEIAANEEGAHLRKRFQVPVTREWSAVVWLRKNTNFADVTIGIGTTNDGAYTAQGVEDCYTDPGNGYTYGHPSAVYPLGTLSRDTEYWLHLHAVTRNGSSSGWNAAIAKVLLIPT